MIDLEGLERLVEGLQDRLDRIAEIAGSEKDATVALVSIGCIAQWTDEEIAADYGLGTALKEKPQ